MQRTRKKQLPSSLGSIENCGCRKVFNCKPENFVGVMLKNTSIREQTTDM